MDLKPKKILIVHASAGHGHFKAAQAIAAAIKAEDTTAEVRLEDGLDFFPPAVKKQYVGGYLWMITKAPALWGISYFFSDNRYLYPVTRVMRRLFNGMNGKRLERLMIDGQWDAIVSTHFMAPEVSAHLKKTGQITSKLVTVVTDFLVHRFWLVPGTDVYCGMTDETRAALESEGVEPSRIRIKGIPVGAAFSSRQEPADARQKLGLKVDRFTVLFTSGGMGASSIESMVAEFCRQSPDAQAVVVCGNNTALKAALETRKAELPNLFVQGFVNNMQDFMDAADLVVGKAGGSTVSETLAKGVPMMILEPVPGQETFNRDILVKRGASLDAKCLADVPTMIAAFRADEPRRQAVLREIAKVGRPNAAVDVAREILS
jgi:processive 1,2-diacylglycerol beta-glucosyltransferase